MSNRVTTIGRKNVEVIGRFQLKVNRDPVRFKITNINSFVPSGKTNEDRMKFMSRSGLVDSLIIDKLVVSFNPDRNEIDLHNITAFINHPDVKLDGFSDQEHMELVRMNLKKSNPKFTLTNIDRVSDEKFDEEVKLIQLRGKLFSVTNPLTIEMLVHLCSSFGIAYKTDISDAERYRKFLLKKIDSYIQVNSENRTAFVDAVDNMKLTEMVYYINEFEAAGIVSYQSGIYKIQDTPVGASRAKLIQYFEQNPSAFQEFKEVITDMNKGKIYG